MSGRLSVTMGALSGGPAVLLLLLLLLLQCASPPAALLPLPRLPLLPLMLLECGWQTGAGR